MSPTVFRHGRYRAFFSREEPRVHVHISSADGEAKFWLEPLIPLASHSGLPARELKRMQWLVVEEHRDEINRSWKAHFG